MRTITLILSIPLSLLCSAQLGFSIVHVGDGNASGEGRSIFETSYGYLLFSAEVDQNTGRTWLYTSRFDLEGEYLDGHTFSGTGNLDVGLVDCVVQEVEGSFTSATLRFASSEAPELRLYRFSAFGDTLITYPIGTEPSQASRDCLAVGDGTYLLAGWCTIGEDPVDDCACLRRVAADGQELWRRTWPERLMYHTVNAVEDGNFLVGGSRFSTTDKTVLMKVNSDGEEIWTRYLGGYSPYSGGAAHATHMSNGDYLVPGSWLPQDSINNSERGFASLYCYAPNGDLRWRRDLLYGRLAGASLSRMAAQGEYWVVGGYYQVPRDPDVATTLWRVDNNGDTLYSRKYWYYGGEGAANAVTYGMDTTSDGGLVLTGTAYEGINGVEPFNHKTWILKLDQHGCLVPGCHTVGLQDYEMALQGALQVSPNPTQDVLRFSLDLPSGYPLQGKVQALVLDAQGKEVARQNIAANGLQVAGTIALNGQAPGLYYLHLRDEVKWLAGQKVVVG